VLAQDHRESVAGTLEPVDGVLQWAVIETKPSVTSFTASMGQTPTALAISLAPAFAIVCCAAISRDMGRHSASQHQLEKGHYRVRIAIDSDQNYFSPKCSTSAGQLD
jgi:hypothetical protein